MIEIIGLVIGVSGIVGLARGRGASPLYAGSIAAAGFVLIRFVGAFFVRLEDILWLMVASWAWLFAVALYLRFVVGANQVKPDGKWACSECGWLNSGSSVFCEACKRPYEATRAART